MKSVACNVSGMAVGVACLALLINRASADDEKQVLQEEKHVIIVQSDQSESDVAENLKKVLHDKLEGLPAEIQKKIQRKLEAVQKSHASDGKSRPQELIISTRQFEANDDANVGVAIAEASDETSNHDATTTLTVTVTEGEVLINGKPVKVSASKGLKKGQVKVDKIHPDRSPAVGPEHQAGSGKPFVYAAAAPAQAEVAERLTRIENELKQIRKLLKKMQKQRQSGGDQGGPAHD